MHQAWMVEYASGMNGWVRLVIWDGALWFWSVIKTIMTDWLSETPCELQASEIDFETHSLRFWDAQPSGAPMVVRSTKKLERNLSQKFFKLNTQKTPCHVILPTTRMFHFCCWAEREGCWKQHISTAMGNSCLWLLCTQSSMHGTNHSYMLAASAATQNTNALSSLGIIRLYTRQYIPTKSP